MSEALHVLPELINFTKISQEEFEVEVKTVDINALGFGVVFQASEAFQREGEFRFIFDFSPLKPVEGLCLLKHIQEEEQSLKITSHFSNSRAIRPGCRQDVRKPSGQMSTSFFVCPILSLTQAATSRL